MRLTMTLVALGVAACSTKPPPMPPKAPNNELIVGEFERHKPDGEQALRFAADGTFIMAKTRADLDKVQPLAVGDWKLDGDQLTFHNRRGTCTESESDRTGNYKVVISKVGIRFAKVADGCARRASLDGQTWWRIK